MPTPTPPIRITCPACKVRLLADSTTCPECGQNLAVLVRETRRVDVFFNEGLAAARAGDDSLGIRRLEDALTLAPQRVDVIDLLARLYLRRGRREDALAAWKRLLQIAPENEAAQQAVRNLEATHDDARRQGRRRIGLIAGVIGLIGLTAGASAVALLRPAAPPAAQPAAAMAPPTATTAPTPTAPPPSPTAIPPTATALPTVTPLPTATTPPTATPFPDYTMKVRDVLAGDPQLANMEISVVQKGSSIFLTGKVTEPTIRDKAVSAARSVLPDDTAVDASNIEINPDYVVKNGDSLQRIAERVLRDARRWKEIADLNGIADPYKLRPGQTLKLPKP